MDSPHSPTQADVNFDQEQISKLRKDSPDSLTEADVRCDQAPPSNRRRANVAFRVLIEDNVSEYSKADKKGKMEITRRIVRTMQSVYGSRFMKKMTKKEDENRWVELTEAQARDKISHALKRGDPKDENGNFEEQPDRRPTTVMADGSAIVGDTQVSPSAYDDTKKTSRNGKPKNRRTSKRAKSVVEDDLPEGSCQDNEASCDFEGKTFHPLHADDVGVMMSPGPANYAADVSDDELLREEPRFAPDDGCSGAFKGGPANNLHRDVAPGCVDYEEV